MRRCAAILFCLFTLLVFVLSICLWVRSYFVGERILIRREWLDSDHPTDGIRGSVYEVFSKRGTVAMRRTYHEGSLWVKPPLGWSYDRFDPDSTYDPYTQALQGENWVTLQRFGFEWHSRQAAYGNLATSRHELTVPFWIFLPAAIPPWIWWRRHRRTWQRGFPIAVASSAVDR